jgi:thiamine monophosphate kinase
MDNTDGIGQSLSELSDASRCAFVVRASALKIPLAVENVSQIVGVRTADFVFNGGADFSLVGTIRGQWSTERATIEFGHPLEIIGHVEAGHGLWLEDGARVPLSFRGWNYFSAQP